MPTIEIDFEVFKALTNRRDTESVTYNDVVRGLLGLSAREASEARQPGNSAEAWVCKGVRFPVGTELRAHYKGKTHAGTVDKDGIVVSGTRSASPSDAARVITGTSVNG